MAATLITPAVLTQPIATNGNKNTIPNTNDQSLGLMSQSTGFPPICSERIADGGKAPNRADFNGAFNLISQQHYFLQNGGVYTFRQDVSDAIGGYPLNACLYYQNSDGEIQILQSLKENNTANFNTNPAYVDDGVNWKSVIPTIGQISLDFLTRNLMNIAQEGKEKITSWCSPDYLSAYSVSTGTSENPNIAQQDGIIILTSLVTNTDKIIMVNNVQAAYTYSTGATLSAFVGKGDPWYVICGYVLSLIFVPLKGFEYVPTPPATTSYYCYQWNGLYYYSDHVVDTAEQLTLYCKQDRSVATSVSDLVDTYTGYATPTGADSFEILYYQFTRYPAGDIS